MREPTRKAIAVVGIGAILPDAPDLASFWKNITEGHYSISEVPPDRWDPALYYDPDPAAPDRTYTKIGGWVRDWEWDPLGWRLPIPPRVSEVMDLTQRLALAVARQALLDYGYPQRGFDPERTAVILGNAMGGDQHLLSATRILFPEVADELLKAPSFAALPETVRQTVLSELRSGVQRRLPDITEDTMPGELANIIAGRIASLYDFKGPNYVTDAACASAMAAISAAMEGLEQHQYDVVLTGGIDANMSASTFVKFCKIGALSATGTRPYAEGADGFVMGEGAVSFILKRLADAERDGDQIYGIIRSLAGSSDGRGKGITAPNPVGQRLAVQRAWKAAGVAPQAGDLVEGHGTSTRVGDVAEAHSLIEAFADADLPLHSIALGSVKSNIGHLKGAAGAAGLLKAVLALHYKQLPPSINFHRPNPGIDFEHSPLRVNTELRPWELPSDRLRRAGVSAFGFGGTNFHAVVDEYVPGRSGAGEHVQVSYATAQGVVEPPAALMSTAQVSGGPVPTASAQSTVAARRAVAGAVAPKTPLRGALLLGGADLEEIRQQLEGVQAIAQGGSAPPPTPPSAGALQAPVRLAIDYGDAAELERKAGLALKALREDQAGRWKALRAKGVFLGRGAPPRVAFLFTGQGSQYANMLSQLRDLDPVVAATFQEADSVMAPLLDRPLTEHIFVDPDDPTAVAAAEESLKQTVITQPAVLATETALCRLLGSYGVVPDMVMGHSLGEYGALVTAGGLPFAHALQAVSARGKFMSAVALEDNGLMAAVFGPIDQVRELIEQVDGYVVIANINSTKECVIGGATAAVEQAMEVVRQTGLVVRQLPVSHAFHTSIVSPAGPVLADMLRTLEVRPPQVPVVANVSGHFYPAGPDVAEEMIDILARQVGSPVHFLKGLNTLYDAGARVFVELGPKRVLYGFVEDVLGGRDDVLALFTNHPRIGDVVSVNQALCGLYASGLGQAAAEPTRDAPAVASVASTEEPLAAPAAPPPAPARSADLDAERTLELGRLFADFLERGMRVYRGTGDAGTSAAGGLVARKPAPGGAAPGAQVASFTRVGITGASLGLPGLERVFDDSAVERILAGEQFITSIPDDLRRAMADRRITRLVKGKDGEARFETITNPADVVKLMGRGGKLDLAAEFGYPEDRLPALDRVTQLAIAAGIDALRDAGIPLVMRYKTTTKGTFLPEGWSLPEDMRDDTGIIFASAFPATDSFAEIITGYHEDRTRRERLQELRAVRERATGEDEMTRELDRRIAELQADVDARPYHFDRRFLFRVLSMGHSQFAEYIGARGPNTQTNGACASTPQALAIARDWIHAGRCRRVIIVTADDITTDTLVPWFGSGFLASGTAATDERVEDAAIPFDRRRHGLIVGMGGAALVVERLDAVQERGILPICEVLGTIVANSAFHGSRLDVNHIRDVMERLVSDVEATWGLDRRALAPETVFVSHETYTPARGGSASAEVVALRSVFGDAADQILVANTKGYTGHAMAVGVEDALAVRMMETGIVPPVPNHREVDPELGPLNLSTGGPYPMRYALRLGAGFGSQIAMSLLRWITPPDGQRHPPAALGYGYRIVDPAAWKAWLRRATGYHSPELEVVKRTLRVKDQGPGRWASAAAAPQAQTQAQAPAEGPQAPVARQAPAAPQAPVTPQAPVAPQAGTQAGGASRQGAGVQAQAEPAPAPSGVIAASASPEDPAGVSATVLGIIAEKTGYPPDMLDADLDLEADLGIDTVKQAEMFAAIRAAYDIPPDDTLKLRDYPTLAHAVRFVYDRRPDLAGPQAQAQAQTQAPMPQAQAGGAQTGPAPTAAGVIADASAQDPVGVSATVLGIIAEKTGYPPDMLDADLDLEADLGIDTVKQAEMFAAIRAAYDIPPDDTLKLRDYPTLAHAVRFVYDRRPDLAGPQAQAQTQAQTSMPQAPSQTQPPSPAQPPSQTQPATPPTTASPGDPAGVGETVIGIIAEKTGYPPDMIDADLDLEADLGIDTVKQAEMFAAIRAAYEIPPDDTLKLRDYPTLAHAVQFVYERRPQLAGPQAQAQAQAPLPQAGPEQTVAAASTTAAAAIPALPTGSMKEANRVPRRVPVARLRPPFPACKPTGVLLEAGNRVVVMSDRGGIGAALVRRLEKRGVEVLSIEGAPATEDLQAKLDGWMAEGPVQGVYWLPALDVAGDPTSLDRATRQEALRQRVKLLYVTMRSLYEGFGEAGTFLVSATRLGGRHGYDADGAVDPLGGAVVGFTKAFARERPAALVKAVDFEPSRRTAALADLLIEETLRDPGAVEVGHHAGHRWTVSLAEVPAGDAASGLTLTRDSVFVVTGAAGSIVSAIIGDLADASGGTFHLLDLTPPPDPADPDLQCLAEDRDGLRRDLFERLKAAGERATPARVEKEIAGLERSQAALAAIRAVEQAGGAAYYHSVDLRDGDAVSAVMRALVQRHGQVDVLLHAAGLEISRLLSDKSPAEFDLVFDVKAEGWFNLLEGLGDAPLGAAVVFSSIAGRFGNGGQADYSAANDLLCKLVSSLRTVRPATHGIAIDWTAWEGIGMAARGSIPAIMKAAGIDMLAPAAGIPIVRRELTTGTQGEVVIAGSLGMMLEERDPTGGLAVPADGDSPATAGAGRASVAAEGGAPGVAGDGPMTGVVRGMGVYGGLVVETDLDPSVQPFLTDHQIDGTPVLPGVMGIEAMVEAARLLFPERRVAAVEDVTFQAPFKFYRAEPRTLTVGVDYTAEGDDVLAHCRLSGSRTLHGRAEPEVTTHFTARVRLTSAPAPAAPERALPESAAGPSSVDIYRLYFHGPAYQVLEKAWSVDDGWMASFTAGLPANHHPPELPTRAAPRLIELCFQTAGLAEVTRDARMGLPHRVDRVEWFGPAPAEGEGIRALATPRDDGAFDVDVAGADGAVCLRVHGYRTMALPGAIPPEVLARLRGSS